MAAAIVRAGQFKIIAERSGSRGAWRDVDPRSVPLIVRWMGTGVTGTRRSWPSRALSVREAP